MYAPDLKVFLEPLILHGDLLRPIIGVVIILRREGHEVNGADIEAEEHAVPTAARHGETIHIVGKVAGNWWQIMLATIMAFDDVATTLLSTFVYIYFTQ